MELKDDLIKKLKTFKVLILDADGVFFDGYESRLIMNDGSVAINKRRHFYDGQAISFLRDIGIRIYFATGEGQPLRSIVDKINNLPSAKSGKWKTVEIAENISGRDKETVTGEWLHKNELQWADVVYIGDDLNDLVAMRKVKAEGGLVVVPANATRHIVNIADIRLKRDGGNGAIREFAECVFDVRNIDETKLNIV